MSEENTPDWAAVYDQLPSQVQEMPYFRRGEDGLPPTLDRVVADISNAAKLQGNMSDTHIRIPPPDATEDQVRDSLSKALKMIPGLREAKEGEDSLPPENIEGYKIPEGMDPDSVKPIREFALKHGWGQEQFTEYVGQLVSDSERAAQDQQAWKESQAAALKEKLGDAKDQHLDKTLAAIADLAPEGFVDKIKDGSVDAGIVLMLDGLVHQMLEMGEESSQFVRQVNAGATELTPVEHQQRAMEIMGQLREMRPHDVGYQELNAKRMHHVQQSNRH